MAQLIEIRILPPVAIARLGDSSTRAENYDLVEAGDWEQDGYRTLQFIDSIEVDEVTGTTSLRTENSGSPVTPGDFKDSEGRVKPVAPFLEVWGVFLEDDGTPSDDLVPVTPAALSEAGLRLEDFEWTVDFANRKISRRTGDQLDAILLTDRDEEKSGMVIAGNDHVEHTLTAQSGNFADPDQSIVFGKIQAIAHEDDEPIKLRFSPGAGKLYQQQPPTAGQSNREQVELKGTWPSYSRTDLDPLPGGLIEAGMFDDSCDGVITISHKDIPTLQASARISSGPPDFSPDTQFLRSIDDEIEQIIKGVNVTEQDYPDDDEGDKQLINDIVDIIQRATDTVRLSNPAGLVRWWRRRIPPQMPMGWQDRLAYKRVVDRHVQWLHILGSYRKDGLSADEKYRLSALLAAFASRLRAQTDLTDLSSLPAPDTWLMPFHMRGSDGSFVVLSERQRQKIDFAIQRFIQYAPDSALARLQNMIWTWAEDAADGRRAFHRIVTDRTGELSLLDVFKEVVDDKVAGLAREESRAVDKVIELIRDGYVSESKLIDWDQVVADGSLNGNNAPILNFIAGMRDQGIRDAITEWLESELVILSAADTGLVASIVAPAPRVRRMNKRDVMAHLRYRPVGNPITTSINSTISNCFPGLEMDFRGIWQRLLRDDVDSEELRYDWVLHETYNAVLARSGETFDARLRILLTDSDGGSVHLDSNDYAEAMEPQNDRFNRLARFIGDNSPDTRFEVQFGGRTFNARLNELIDKSSGYIKRPAVGELTHGLCSPWQRDFRDCGCVYWSANRPDFVNVTTSENGESVGENWMSAGKQMDDTGVPVDEYTHQDLFDDWQGKLEFVVRGKTTP